MIRAGLALLVLAALLRAADVELPPAAHTGEEAAYPRITVHLTRDGRVLVDPEEEPDPRLLDILRRPTLKQVTLDELGTHIDRMRRRFDDEQEAKGESGYEDVGLHQASKLYVLVRADACAPWSQVDWLLTVCCEQKIYKVQLAARRGKEDVALDLFILVDSSSPGSGDESTETRVPLTIRADPESAAFDYGEGERPDLGGFAAYAKAAKAEARADLLLIGKIKASAKTPVRHVIAALDLFRAAGYEHVHAMGLRIPPPELRKLRRLPAPRRNSVRSVCGLVGAFDTGEEDVEGPGDFDEAIVRLPAVADARAGAGQPRVTIHLTREGEIRIEPTEIYFGDARLRDALGDGPGLKSVTLDDLGTYLDKAKRTYDLLQRVEGRDGFEEVAPGIKATPLHVLIRADAAAPWEHVELLMTICAEQKYYKTQLAATRGGEEVALDLFLPVDRGIDGEREEPPKAIRATLEIRARAESVAFAFLERKQEDLAGFRDYVRAIRETAGSAENCLAIGEIKASRRTPVRHVTAALEVFRAEGYGHVHAWGVTIPDPEDRRRKRLPPPETNAVPRSVRGTGGRPGFEEPVEEDPEDPD